MRLKTTHGLIVIVAVLIGVGIFLIPDRMGDGQLKAQVVETLRAIVDLDTGKIEVFVENGVVTLRGTLPNHEARRLVIEEVKKVNGVKRVVDETVVNIPSDQKAEPNSGSQH